MTEVRDDALVLSIGLTGGIGAGKSAVASRLARCGAVVVDADAIAREVVRAGTPGLDAVVEEFGADVLCADGELDRPALGRLVFADEARRRALNAIVHPLVRARSAELVAHADADSLVVHDIPLLVENGMAAGFALTLVVRADEQTRLDRLTRHRGMTAEDAAARIRAQASDTERAAVADVLLPNEGDLAELQSRVDSLYADRLRPFADNLAAGRVATTAGVRLHAYDPTWPQQYDRIAARLQSAGGAAVLRVDHIGSTAVPGIVAKDIIDVQVTVADLDTADALREVLQRCGYPLVAGISQDAPRPPHSDPARWGKRLHAAADPGRPTNVHLRVAGSPGWRFALAFRDWLRADGAARQAYDSDKQRLAAEHADSRDRYAEAKEPWFDAAWPQVQDWITESGWQPPA